MRFWGCASRGFFFASSTVHLESLSLLSDLEKNSSGTKVIFLLDSGLKEQGRPLSLTTIVMLRFSLAFFLLVLFIFFDMFR